jgi:hypothetical protein
MARISDLPRPVMRDIGRALLRGLTSRRDAGPAEPALDAFIPELEQVVARLDRHVGGGELADAGRRAALARLELADCTVDTWLRHHESFVYIEATRRVGPHVPAAKALHASAFPEGLGIVDDYIPDENRACRSAIAVLRAPENTQALSAIGLPAGWLDQWEAALDESDAAFNEANSARQARTDHVGKGQDTEADFSDLAMRLRRYVGSRASRNDKARIAEGKQLLAPLVEALKKADTDSKARATRRENAAPRDEAAPPPPPAAPAPAAAATPPAPNVPPLSPTAPLDAGPPPA